MHFGRSLAISVVAERLGHADPGVTLRVYRNVTPTMQREAAREPDSRGVRALLPVIEDALAPFEPRPHWGKLFMMSPRPSARPTRSCLKFVELLGRFDPAGKFPNAFMDLCIFGSD